MRASTMVLTCLLPPNTTSAGVLLLLCLSKYSPAPSPSTSSLSFKVSARCSTAATPTLPEKVGSAGETSQSRTMRAGEEDIEINTQELDGERGAGAESEREREREREGCIRTERAQDWVPTQLTKCCFFLCLAYSSQLRRSVTPLIER